MSHDKKPLEFIGAARRELRAFPKAAREVAGEELYRLQRGREPRDWKPLSEIGPGACEIRVRSTVAGVVQFRVIYVAKFGEALYVLHAFEKKTQQMPTHNQDLAQARYKQLLRQRRNLER
jgi:phage-related protein